MAKRIRVGVGGLTHGHVGGLIGSWSKVEGAEMVAVADSTDLLAGQEGFARKYTDWREMLDKEELDVLIVTSDNVESTEIAIAALGKGISCMVEKAMAANAADADRMLAAAKASKGKLIINWPLAWNPWIYDFKKQIDSGELGHVFHLRYRNGHFGPKEIGCGKEFVEWLYDENKNGGGAIADFGSYGAVLARYLLGMPESVFAIRGNFTKDYPVPDDHAVILLKYPKATAFLEGTWATNGFDSGPNAVVHGTKQTIAAFGAEVETSSGWDKRSRATPSELPGNGLAEYFLSLIESGSEAVGIMNPEIAADGNRILDAAIRSAASGCAEKP